MDNPTLIAVQKYPAWINIRDTFEAAIKQAFEESTDYYQKHGKEKPIPFTCGVVDANGNPYRVDVDYIDGNKRGVEIIVYIAGEYCTALKDYSHIIRRLEDDQIKEYCKRQATKWANTWANENLS